MLKKELEKEIVRLEGEVQDWKNTADFNGDCVFERGKEITRLVYENRRLRSWIKVILGVSLGLISFLILAYV